MAYLCFVRVKCNAINKENKFQLEGTNDSRNLLDASANLHYVWQILFVHLMWSLKLDVSENMP